MTTITGADATRLRELVNKAAGLPWPSVRADGTVIEGSVGTTSIRDVTVDEVTREVSYELDGEPEHYIIRERTQRTRLTQEEKDEADAILTRAGWVAPEDRVVEEVLIGRR